MQDPEGHRERLANALRGRNLTHEDLGRLLQHAMGDAATPAQARTLLVALGCESGGDVDPERLLSFLYSTEEFDEEAMEATYGGVHLLRETSGITDFRSPREREFTNEAISEMKGFLEEETHTQEAVKRYQAMARQLAAEFKKRGSAPQAEAFIEQVCVENILEGCLFIGHVKTDLDSVAGAIGAAHLWRGVATRAERQLNGEIEYALQFAGLERPPYFDDVPGAAAPNDAGELLGICLVDHNEEKQMVDALRQDPQRNKRIRGVIDHHALAESLSSEKPMFMDIRPWGSMSSIVAHSYIRSNRVIPVPIARILLAAILSDTLNLQSVTTTTADRMLVSLLSVLGDCPDPDGLARAMFRAKTQWIVNLGAYEMTRGDQKDFSCCGWKVGIAVLEVTDTAPVLDVADQIIMELRILKVEKGKLSESSHDRRKELDFAYLFVVDVANQSSVLLIAGGRELSLAKAAFPGCPLREAKPGLVAPGNHLTADETLMEVGPIVSRKAQFVPAFFKALSGNFQCHKPPQGSFSEAEALQAPDDEVYLATKWMAKGEGSYHDSIRLVRNYTRLTRAMSRRSSTPLDIATAAAATAA